MYNVHIIHWKIRYVICIRFGKSDFFLCVCLCFTDSAYMKLLASWVQFCIICCKSHSFYLQRHLKIFVVVCKYFALLVIKLWSCPLKMTIRQPQPQKVECLNTIIWALMFAEHVYQNWTHLTRGFKYLNLWY